MKKNKLLIPIFLQIFISSLFLASSLSATIQGVQANYINTGNISSTAESSTILCPNLTVTPTIDGIMAPGEWSDATRRYFFFRPISSHPDDNINIFVKHNDTHLSICYDVEPDNTNDEDDSFFLYLDLNNNGTKDLRFYLERDGMVEDIYQNPYGSLTFLDYTVAFGFNLTAQESGRNHTIIEITISINRTANFTGQNLLSATSLPLGINPIGVVFAGYGTLSPQWYYGNQTNDIADSTYNASFYADLLLLDGPLPDGSLPDGQNLLTLLLLMQQGAGGILTGDTLILTLTLAGIGAAVVLIIIFLKKR